MIPRQDFVAAATPDLLQKKKKIEATKKNKKPTEL